MSNDKFVLSLIHYITQMPSPADSSQRKFRYPFNASRILSAGPNHIIERIFPNDASKGPVNLDLVNPLFDFFAQKGDLNPLLCSYVCGALIALFEPKPHIMYQFCLDRERVIVNFLSHLSDHSVCTFVQKVFLRHDYCTTEPSPEQPTAHLSKRLDELSLQIVKNLLESLTIDSKQCFYVLSLLTSTFDDFASTMPEVKNIFYSDLVLQKLFEVATAVISNQSSPNDLVLDPIFKLITQLVVCEAEQVKDKSIPQNRAFRASFAAFVSRASQLLTQQPTHPMLTSSFHVVPRVGRKWIATVRLISVAVQKDVLEEACWAEVLPSLLLLARHTNDLLWKNLSEIFAFSVSSGREPILRACVGGLVELIEWQLDSLRKEGRAQPRPLLPNCEPIAKLIQSLRSLPQFPSSQLDRLSQELDKFKVNDSSYPQPEADDLNFSEIISEMQPDIMEDGVLTTLPLHMTEDPRVNGTTQEEGLAQSTELLDLMIDRDGLRSSLNNVEENVDQVITEYPADGNENKVARKVANESQVP